MATPLKVLMVEDSEDDAAILVDNLSHGNYDLETMRVDSREDLIAALAAQPWDIVLMDFTMPGFDGFEALRTTKENAPDVPIVLVSGTVGEDTAVATMRAGASDYVMKGKMARLLPAIEQQLIHARERRERRNAEEQLRFQDELFRRRYEALFAGVIVLDATGKITYVNKAAGEILGLSPDEFLRCASFDPRWEFLQDDGSPFPPEKHPAAVTLRTRDPVRGVTIGMLAKGTSNAHWVLVNAEPLPGATANELSEVVVSFVDISSRKRAEEDLRRREAQFSALFQNSTDGIMAADIQTKKLRMANPAACRMLGYTEEQLTSMHISDVHPPESLDHVLSEFGAQARGEKRVVEDLPCLRKDGTVFYADVTVGLVAVDGERWAVGFFRDITDRKRAEEELESRSRELHRRDADLRQLVNVTSHDLQEPLGTISRYTQLIADRYRGKLGPDADELIGYVVRAAVKMHSLIEGLRQYSQLDITGKEPEPVDCAAIVSSVVDELKGQIDESGAQVTREFLPTVVANGSQLSQVFRHLIGNAIKFRGDEPPHIHISAARADSEWVFSVRDNGIGIAPEHHESVFEIFQRLHADDQYEGLGTGLAICKKIVERHGGRMWVESEVGKGSTFCFTLSEGGQVRC